MLINRRFSFAALLVVLLAAALVPALASAGGRNSTKIVVSLEFPAFHGKLTSPRNACLGSRTVKMYREKSGRKKQLGRDTSEDNGKWAVPVAKNLASGSYYATVAKRGKCRAARSQLLTIG
jgi:hypothetical protein